MKKCVYAVCALLWAGCTASRPASDGSKDREQKETVQIDSLAPNPFIRHMYTADPSAMSGPTDVCMCMPPMTSHRLAVAT